MFSLTRLEILGGVLALLALYVAYDHLHSLHVGEERGEAKTITKDNGAVQVQEKHDATADAEALDNLRKQNIAMADWISHHPVQPLIVRRGPSCGAQRGTVASGSSPSDVQAGDGSGMQRPDSIDIGPRVRLLAIVAERAAAFDSACEATVAGRAR